LREIQLGREQHLDSLIDQIEQLRACAARLGQEYLRPIPEAKPTFERINATLPIFERNIATLATAQDPQLATLHASEAMAAALDLQKDILTLSRMMHERLSREQAEALAWFRWLLLALGIVFLLVINIAVMVLMRMAHMIVRPVDKLLEGSRRLAAEDFSHRIDVGQNDEFAELARGYNQLAAALEANEQRKIETLAQTAVMLNHELNNASSIIKLQLQLLRRQSSGDAAFERALLQIDANLSRMTAVTEALKHVRRIVLTDYNADIKMLDLQRSIGEGSGAPVGRALVDDPDPDG